MVFFIVQRAENFHQLAAHRHLILMGEVFDELLGDGGGAIGGFAPEEHIQTGLDSPQPVHAVVVEETLVFNGDAGVFQIGRDVLDPHPDAILAFVELFQLLPLPGLPVLVVDDRGLVQGEALHREVHLLGEIIFNIHCKYTGKDQQCQKAREQQRAEDLSDPAPDTPGPGRLLPLLTWVFLPFCHSYTSVSIATYNIA